MRSMRLRAACLISVSSDASMSVFVEEIDRWNAGDVREVFNATRSRAEAAREAANGIAELPAFGS